MKFKHRSYYQLAIRINYPEAKFHKIYSYRADKAMRQVHECDHKNYRESVWQRSSELLTKTERIMSDNIIGRLMEAVAEGAKWNVDFKSRRIKVNGTFLVEKGKFNILTGTECYPPDQFLWHVEKAYEVYKHSIPSERSESKGRKYFLALSEKELSDEDMMYGVSRDMAQAELESFILCSMLEGVTWQESWGKWFWQSPNDKNLVLLREWFEP